MHVIMARNVNEALPKAVTTIMAHGVEMPSRAGMTLEVPEPVATAYVNPEQRVLFSPERDANPFFHFFEALWILAGREDVAFLERFNKRMAEFSDDGKVFHAPYGHRLRHPRNGTDQISSAIRLLKANTGTRQVVLQIWDNVRDLGARKADIPCNDLIFFRVRDNQLDMTVCCRSNDLIWGAYGANVVQFSTLQEYIARHVGVNLGSYWQMSNSFHVYTEGAAGAAWQRTANATHYPDLYTDPPAKHFADDERVMKIQPYPLMQSPEEFDIDLAHFFARYDRGHAVTASPESNYVDPFFVNVVSPAWRAHTAYKAGQWELALQEVSGVAALDWRYAMEAWLRRRHAAHLAKHKEQ